MNYPKIFVTKTNSNVTVLFNGTHYSFSGERAEEVFEASMEYARAYRDGLVLEPDVENLLAVLNPPLRKEFAKYLSTDGTNIYLGQTNIPVPNKLAEQIKIFVEKDYPVEPLINFWKQCMLNPSEVGIKGFFKYISDYGVTITDYGYAVLYKAVNKKDRKTKGNNTLAESVSMLYLKVKRWKKSPAHYIVFENENRQYDIVVRDKLSGIPKEAIIGNLNYLHSKIDSLVEDEELTFKPSRQGTHGNEIQLGVPVVMPRDMCDPNIRIDCSYGLHVGSFNYVSSFGQGMDAILAILVSPKDVVALPEYDHSKIRVCKYMPYAIIERDINNNWTELESNFFESDYIDTEDEELLRLLEEDPSSLTSAMINEVQKTIIGKEITSNSSNQPTEVEDEMHDEYEDDYDDFDDDDDYEY